MPSSSSPNPAPLLLSPTMDPEALRELWRFLMRPYGAGRINLPALNRAANAVTETWLLAQPMLRAMDHPAYNSPQADGATTCASCREAPPTPPTNPDWRPV